MTRAQFKAQHRANRIAERQANKAANREAGWRAWAAGMALLRSILVEEKDKLQALAVADWRMDRITPKNWGR
jgi:hypothetical protein